MRQWLKYRGKGGRKKTDGKKKQRWTGLINMDTTGQTLKATHFRQNDRIAVTSCSAAHRQMEWARTKITIGFHISQIWNRLCKGNTLHKHFFSTKTSLAQLMDALKGLDGVRSVPFVLTSWSWGWERTKCFWVTGQLQLPKEFRWWWWCTST